MEDDINLGDFIKVLWRQKIFIIVIFLVFILSATLYISLTAPVYQSVCLISLGNYPDKNYTTQQSAREIILSDDFLNNVNKELNWQEFSIESIRDYLKLDPVEDTGLLKITLLTSDRKGGIDFLEKVIRLFTEQSSYSYNQYHNLLSKQLEIMQTNLKTIEKDIGQTREVLASIENASDIGDVEKDIRRSKTLEYLQSEENQKLGLQDKIMNLQKELDGLKNVEVLQNPSGSEKPVKPRRFYILVMAGFMGLMLGVLGAFIKDYFSQNHLSFKDLVK